MDSTEQHTSQMGRRHPRYEIDTELHVTTPDERATMRGRSLNIQRKWNSRGICHRMNG